MKRRLHILVLVLSISLRAYSQNVGINTTGATPNADAILDLNTGTTWTNSNGKGFLIPKMNTTEINGIASPIPVGLMVFNTDCVVFNYWNGTTWVAFPASTYGPQAVSASVGPNPICSGTVTLTGNATGATSYSWTGPDHFTSSVQNPTVNVTGTVNAGYYILTASNECGSVTVSTDSLEVGSGGSSGSQTFNYDPLTVGPAVNTGQLQTFTVPSCVTTVTVTAYGAQGGTTPGGGVGTGGEGAEMEATFTVTPAEVLTILVGDQGGGNSSGGQGAGGGGGSFVVDNSGNLLIAAGGGGGGGGNGATNNGLAGVTSGSGTVGGNSSFSGTGGSNNGGGGGGSDGGNCYGGSGGGGGGYNGNGGLSGTGGNDPGAGGGANQNGATGGATYVCATIGGTSFKGGGNGGVGCSGSCNYIALGGYGGGGGTGGGGGGGGGGYSGGGGGGYEFPNTSGGGGGGSYVNTTLGTPIASGCNGGVQTGNGKVIISW